MIFLLYLLTFVESTVIGIDFGSELVKISVIKPGKKLVIVENEQSKRATPVSFSITSEGRLFGLKSHAYSLKHPEGSLSVIKQILGKPFKDVLALSKLSQHYQMVPIEESSYGGFSFGLLDSSFEIELVAGMTLNHFKEMVTLFAKTEIKDCAISVPSGFTRASRLGLINSVTFSGLNLLGLIHENSAAALYYALDRVDNITDHVFVIVNVGSSYLQVSVIDCWGFYDKNKYLSHVEVLGHESTSHFAGDLLDYSLSEIIVQDFFNKHSINLKDFAKSMTRLLREVNNAKKTLSANKSVVLKVENIIKGIDLSFEISREKLHEIIENNKNFLVSPLQKLLERLRLSVNEIHSFELIGGVSRIPKIQDVLEKEFKVKFATHIDPNEAVAQGSALYAAKDSITVTMKPLVLVDVFTCEAYVKTLTKKIKIFDKSSKLISRKNVTITLDPEEIVTLVSECDENTEEFYKYSFEESGKLNFEFVLDKNGFFFLGKALSAQNFAVKFTRTDVSVPRPPNDSEIDSINAKLSSFIANEKRLKDLSAAKNSIESITYYLREKLQDETFQHVTTLEEREGFERYIDDLSTWIDSKEFLSVNASEIDLKIYEIRNLMASAVEREQEFAVRDHLIEEANKYFKKLEEFMVGVTETATWIPKEEIDGGWVALNEARKWLNDMVEEQAKLSPWENPVLTSKLFDEKFTALRSKLEKLAYSKPKAHKSANDPSN